MNILIVGVKQTQQDQHLVLRNLAEYLARPTQFEHQTYEIFKNDLQRGPKDSTDEKELLNEGYPKRLIFVETYKGIRHNIYVPPYNDDYRTRTAMRYLTQIAKEIFLLVSVQEPFSEQTHHFKRIVKFAPPKVHCILSRIDKVSEERREGVIEEFKAEIQTLFAKRSVEPGEYCFLTCEDSGFNRATSETMLSLIS